ncbi:2-oxo-4-hydroxy-4-carboxy-5-ureidoimidazoline decarboxylase [Streptomyces sp. NBC_00631]|uniref:2-oxo-4-hydroxy-4-carboxy-5-ureidoimidazoline decarboxylase n=1 Tax=Streptomyces sp. NBC_00631 TaxID=2975793 RepID=UPI0030DFBF84
MTRGPTLPAHRLPHLPAPLDAFNAAPDDEAGAFLLHCLHSLRWARRVSDHRPYPDVESLLAAADEAAYDLSPDDLSEALAGECLPELPEDTYTAATTALTAAHAAYEAKFGHVFVIYLGDASPAECLDHVLAGIRSRLTNDPEEERVVAAEELRRLAGGRLAEKLRGTGNCATSPNTPAPGKCPHPAPRMPHG